MSNRQSIRLEGYDYTQPGAYFITLVTAGRENIFGQIKGGEMILNNFGSLITALWQALPVHFPVVSDDLMVMPNHLHGIIILRPEDMGISGTGPVGGSDRASKYNHALECGRASGRWSLNPKSQYRVLRPYAGRQTMAGGPHNRHPE